jgi:hypothetical protein
MNDDLLFKQSEVDHYGQTEFNVVIVKLHNHPAYVSDYFSIPLLGEPEVGLFETINEYGYDVVAIRRAGKWKEVVVNDPLVDLVRHHGIEALLPMI